LDKKCLRRGQSEIVGSVRRLQCLVVANLPVIVVVSHSRYEEGLSEVANWNEELAVLQSWLSVRRNLFQVWTGPQTTALGPGSIV